MPTLTRNLRLDRKELTSLTRRWGKLSLWSLKRMASCHAWSKAASASRKSAAVIPFVFIKVMQSSDRRKSCSLVIRPFLNPLWEEERSLFDSRYDERRDAMIRSNSFAREEMREIGRQFFASLLSFPHLGVIFIVAVFQIEGK